jgi:dTDP-4-amino-4,6-dideoxygalactose transaminase
VYHLFPVRTAERDALRAHLTAAGIGTLVHYPVPLSSQKAFAGCDPAPCPVAIGAAAGLLSLPLHPRLGQADVTRVADEIHLFGKGHT